MNSMAVEPDSYFSQSNSTSTSTSTNTAETTAHAAMNGANARSIPSLKDSMPETPAAFTWGAAAAHGDMASYITTPSIFATPFPRGPGMGVSESAGDYFGAAATAASAAADPANGSTSTHHGNSMDMTNDDQTPRPATTSSTAIQATTASLPPSVLQRFQAAAHHTPGIVLPSLTPAAVNIESFAASSPSYFPSTDADQTSSSASPASIASPPSSSFATSSSLQLHPATPAPFVHPPTPFMPPVPHNSTRPDGLSWVPYPPNTRTNPLLNRRSTSHLSLSAPIPTIGSMSPAATATLSKSASSTGVSATTPTLRPLHRHSTIDLPPATELEPVDQELVVQWIQSSTEQRRHVLLLDMRPSINYAVSTIRNAINISVPNMLLRRPTFTLAMVMDQLTTDRELALFADWKTCANIVFFDASGAAPVVGSPTFCMVQKFQREGCSAKLWYLRGGYNAFASKHSDLLQTGSEDTTSSSQQKGSEAATETIVATPGASSAPSSSTTPSSQSITSPPRQRLHLGSLPTMMTTPMAGPMACQTPMIENPNVNPLFESVRQAMGLNTNITEEIPVRLPKGFSVDVIRQYLPPWLVAAVDQEQGKTRLAEGFQKVEVNEQKRLALLMLPQAMRAGRTIGYSIGAGIEKGLKNRYNNVWPYDHCRVKIGECATNTDDYINASFLHPPFGKKAYIATQGPLPQTSLDFWKVAWEQDSRVVVMLTREMEMGRLKCHAYWPTKDEPLMKLEGIIEVQFVSESIPDPNSPTVLVRHLILRHIAAKEERAIAQIQYSGWPDFGVPQTPIDVLRVVDLANHFNEDKPTRPMIVHCSAGCGRTGAFCVIDSVLHEIQHHPDNLKHFANGPAPSPLATLYHPSERGERGVLAELRSRPSTSVNERVQGLMGGHQRHGSGGSINGGHEGPLGGKGLGGAGSLRDSLSNGDAGGGPSVDTQQHKRDVVFETVSAFREQRMSMVQTLRQYVFCYEAIFWWLAIELTKDTPNMVVLPPPETLHDAPPPGPVLHISQQAGVTLSRANAPITTTDSEFSFFG